MHVLAAPTQYGPWMETSRAGHGVRDMDGVDVGDNAQHNYFKSGKIQPFVKKENTEVISSKSKMDAQALWRELDCSLRDYRAQLSAEDRRKFDGE